MQLLAGLHRPALPDRLALFRQFAHALARYPRRRDFSRPPTHRTGLALFFRRKRASVRPPVRRGCQILDLSNLRQRPCRLPPARRGHAHTRGLVTRARRLATGRRVNTRGFGRPALSRQRHPLPSRAPHLRPRLSAGALLRPARHPRTRQEGASRTPHSVRRLPGTGRFGAPVNRGRLAARLLFTLAAPQ